MTLFSGQVVKRKPQDVLWETPLQKGVREIVDKHMDQPPDRWRRIPQDNNHTIVLSKEKEGMAPYEGNWHTEELKKIPRIGYCKKLEDWNPPPFIGHCKKPEDIQDLVRKEVEWFMTK